MSIAIENTPLWKQISKIFSSEMKEVRSQISATLHTDGGDYEILKVSMVDTVRDYVTKIGDQCFVQFTMPLGEYLKTLMPYRDNMMITLKRVKLNG